MFENPNSSKAAKVWDILPWELLGHLTLLQILVIVSSLFLLASICMLILSTIPEFQVSIERHLVAIKPISTRLKLRTTRTNCSSSEWPRESSFAGSLWSILSDIWWLLTRQRPSQSRLLHKHIISDLLHYFVPEYYRSSRYFTVLRLLRADAAQLQI